MFYNSWQRKILEDSLKGITEYTMFSDLNFWLNFEKKKLEEKWRWKSNFLLKASIILILYH